MKHSSGNLAIFAAIRRASSLVSSLAADRRPAYPLFYAAQYERPRNTLSFAYLKGTINTGLGGL
jgi:hypothetical protein